MRFVILCIAAIVLGVVSAGARADRVGFAGGSDAGFAAGAVGSGASAPGELTNPALVDPGLRTSGGGEITPPDVPPTKEPAPPTPPSFFNPGDDVAPGGPPDEGDEGGDIIGELPREPDLPDLIGIGGVPPGDGAVTDPPGGGSGPETMAVPLPPAAWGGVALMGVIGGHRLLSFVRRRRWA